MNAPHDHEETAISRVVRTHAEARESYNRISRWYDLIEGYWEEKPRREGLSLLSVKEGETVLEIGFGTGLSLVRLAQGAGASGKVYGIDISPGMAREAAKRLTRKGLSGRVELLAADFLDASTSTLPEGSFDAIFMSFVLELFDTPEIALVLDRCKRLLNDGGRICVVSLTAEGPATRLRRLYEYGHRKLPRLIDCRPILTERSLRQANLRTERTSLSSIWGLPVEIVLAFK